MKSTKDILSIIFNILLVMFFILPQNAILYAIIPISYFVISDMKIRQRPRVKSYSLIFTILLLLSFLFNVLSPWLDLKSAVRVFELVVIFFFFGRQKVLEISNMAVMFLVVFIVASQFSFVSPAFNDFIDSWYPISEAEEILVYKNATINDVGAYSVRFGGIYRNPNTCALFLNLLFAIIVLEKEKYNKVVFWVLIAFIFVGIVLSGSRTAFVVIVAYYLIYLHNSNKNALLRMLPILVVGVAAFVLIGNEFGDFRLFQVGKGLDDSMTEKTNILVAYFNETSNPIRLLFGCFTIDAIPYLTNIRFAGTDNDIGNIIASYGFLFVFALVGFFTYLYKHIRKEYRILFAVLLWCISGSVIMAYRIVAVLMLLLSVYYGKSISQNKFNIVNK